MSDGDDGEDDPVPPLETNSYKSLFPNMAPREAVLDVVCRAALLMGKLCDDNLPEDDDISDEESRMLALEAYELVTKYLLALFGPLNTTKVYRLAYHLLDELLLRGNLVDADTSVNEMLHKLAKN